MVAFALFASGLAGQGALSPAVAKPSRHGGSRTIEDAADSTGPLDLRSVSLTASRGRIAVSASTAGPWSVDDIARFPAGPDAYLCLQLRQGRGRSRLCLGPRRGRSAVLGLARRGRRRSTTLIPAKVIRPSQNGFRATFRAGAAGIRPGRFAWAVGSHSTGPACTAPALPCADLAPDRGFARLRLESERPTGCTHHGPSFVTHGPSGQKLIGIGFDDGPSDYTSAVLNVLNRYDSHATFFEIGQEAAGRSRVMGRILDSGNEIGNHSFHHEVRPSSDSIAATNAAIRSATGFTPCLFRPPDGAVDSALIQRAHALHMTTVNWDVDPRDWATPGSGAIASAVISGAHRGSIIVMHDGGGPRSETVAALPSILSHFRHRGYRFVTITELLNNRFILGR